MFPTKPSASTISKPSSDSDAAGVGAKAARASARDTPVKSAKVSKSAPKPTIASEISVIEAPGLSAMYLSTLSSAAISNLRCW